MRSLFLKYVAWKNLGESWNNNTSKGFFVFSISMDILHKKVFLPMVQTTKKIIKTFLIHDFFQKLSVTWPNNSITKNVLLLCRNVKPIQQGGIFWKCLKQWHTQSSHHMPFLIAINNLTTEIKTWGYKTG